MAREDDPKYLGVVVWQILQDGYIVYGDGKKSSLSAGIDGEARSALGRFAENDLGLAYAEPGGEYAGMPVEYSLAKEKLANLNRFISKYSPWVEEFNSIISGYKIDPENKKSRSVKFKDLNKYYYKNVVFNSRLGSDSKVTTEMGEAAVVYAYNNFPAGEEQVTRDLMKYNVKDRGWLDSALQTA